MKNKLAVWYRASRPFTLSASIIPVLAGSSLAYWEGQFSLLFSALALIASLLVQAGANMIDEFSDHARPEGSGKLLAPYKVIALGLLSSGDVKRSAAVCFGIAAVIGIYFTFIAGWLILAICLASAIVAYFYSAGPRPLGSIGLGHPLVFLFMGPVMVIGTFYTQTQTLTSEALQLALPVGCTVTAILIANDLRDMDEDRAVAKITPVTLLGLHFGKLEWTLLTAAAFLTIPILASAINSGLWSLLPLLAIFQAVKAARLVWRAKERAELAKTLPATSALHLQLGLLLSLMVVFSRLTD